VNHVYKVELLNNGIGPALIKSCRMQVDGQEMIGEGSEPMEKALKAMFPQYQYQHKTSYVTGGYMMPPKETRNLVT